MNFKIPFTLGPISRAKDKSKFYIDLVKPKKNTLLEKDLKYSDAPITREEYLGICLKTFVFIFISWLIGLILLLTFLRGMVTILIPTVISFLVAIFAFSSQLLYPRLYNKNKSKEIERNLVPALQDMLVQLNSGIPLYNILINLSAANYGSLSEEFKKAVKEINAGSPQIEVLESLGEKSSSPFLKRYLWQLSNGMRAGSDISIVIKSSIKTLQEEQLIQIQNYGNKLNPLIMFYMLTSVILPALAITFLTILASMINLPKTTTYYMFFGLMGGVIFIQVMFLGIIKSALPTLL